MALQELRGYQYTRPENGHALETWQILPIEPPVRNLGTAALAFQEVMYDAWRHQFADPATGVSEEALRTEVDPSDPSKIAAQGGKIIDQTGPNAVSRYAIGTHVGNIEYRRLEQPPYVTMIGKAHEQRRYPRIPFSREHLADISNIFVRPGMQHQGRGTSMAHFLLDSFRDETVLGLYDYPKLNPLVHATLARQNFLQVKSWSIQMFGQTVEQGLYLYKGDKEGTVGEYREVLEEEHRWLAQRTLLDELPEFLRRV